MVRYDKRTGALMPTDLGRAASHFYLRAATIFAFNEGLGERGAPGLLARRAAGEMAGENKFLLCVD